MGEGGGGGEGQQSRLSLAPLFSNRLHHKRLIQTPHDVRAAQPLHVFC